MLENINLPDDWNVREQNEKYLEAVSDNKKKKIMVKMLSLASYEQELPRVKYFEKENPYQRKTGEPEEEIVVPPEDDLSEEIKNIIK